MKKLFFALITSFLFVATAWGEECTGPIQAKETSIGIDEENGVYLIRGDNTFKTERIPFDKIIGIMTSFNRNGKHFSVLDKGYLRYVRFWSFIYPIRYVIYQPWRAARFLYRKIF